MSKVNLRNDILYLLDLASREEQAFLAVLSEEERASEGDWDRWSAKDVIAHIVTWKRRFLDYLELPKENYSGDIDIDAINLEIFLQRRTISWSDIFLWSEQVYENLIQIVQTFENEEFLENCNFLYEKDHMLLHDHILWKVLVWYGYVHPIFHLSQYYVKNGPGPEGKNYSLKILQEAAGFLQDLDDDLGWHGEVSNFLDSACNTMLHVL